MYVLYVYENIVSENVKNKGYYEMEWLFNVRMLKNKLFFINNDLIKTNYEFALKLVNYFSNKKSYE